jgi:hypothetical protein
MAMAVSNNFYGATALAMLYPLLLWSVYITHLDKWIWVRGASMPVLAYGFTAFWLVPSYLQITLNNMRFVSAEGNLWSRWVALAFVVAFVLLSDQFARGKRESMWFTFLTGATVLFAINVLGNHFLDFRIIGEPARLVPEFDLLLICFAVELLRRLWYAELPLPWVRRALATAVVLFAFSSSIQYLRHGWELHKRTSQFEDRVEYQLQDWVAKNMPGSRMVPAGSVRFWFNVWNDIPQLGGGSEQGLLNPKTQPAQWHIFLAPEGDVSKLWLQVMAVDGIIVNSKTSREHYHDYVFPDKFNGLLPVAYDNGEGDTIYSVPRRYKGLARVVDRARFDALPEIPGNGELPQLQQWYDVVEKGPEAPTETRWDGTDVFHVKAPVQEGQSVWIAESFDSNWRAYSGGQRLPIRMDKLGFMVIDAPPGDHDIRMEFPTPLSNIAGRLVTGLCILLAAGMIWYERRRA